MQDCLRHAIAECATALGLPYGYDGIAKDGVVIVKRYLNVVGIILGISAFVWIACAIARDLPSLSGVLLNVHPGWGAVTFVLGMTSLFLNACLFREFIQSESFQPVALRSVARLLFLGQIARHLPGRFWGVAVQIEGTRRELPSGRAVYINLCFMLLAMITNTVLSLALLSTDSQLVRIVLICAVPAFMSWLMLYSVRVFAPWLLRFGSLLPSSLRERMSNFGRDGRKRELDWRWLWLWQALSWYLYLLAWLAMSQAFGLPQIDWISVCANYTLAWLVGFLSIVTPGGIGIREATFVILVNGVLSEPVAAVVAIIVRLWLLATDLALAAAMLVWEAAAGS